MERLTIRREDGSIETRGKEYSEIHMGIVPCTRGNDRYDIRLAEYEDTDHTPEDIEMLIRAHSALREENTQIRTELKQSEADNAALVEIADKLEGIAKSAIVNIVSDNSRGLNRKLEKVLNDRYTADVEHPGTALPELVQRVRELEKTNKHLHEIVAEQGKKITEYESNPAIQRVRELEVKYDKLSSRAEIACGWLERLGHGDMNVVKKLRQALAEWEE